MGGYVMQCLIAANPAYTIVQILHPALADMPKSCWKPADRAKSVAFRHHYAAKGSCWHPAFRPAAARHS